jgi:hypothetical protein
MTDNSYNGWTNWETFTVGSLILNDEGLYLMACNYERNAVNPTWKGFVEYACLESLESENVSFDDPSLDYNELDEVIQEINA